MSYEAVPDNRRGFLTVLSTPRSAPSRKNMLNNRLLCRGGEFAKQITAYSSCASEKMSNRCGTQQEGPSNRVFFTCLGLLKSEQDQPQH